MLGSVLPSLPSGDPFTLSKVAYASGVVPYTGRVRLAGHPAGLVKLTGGPRMSLYTPSPARRCAAPGVDLARSRADFSLKVSGRPRVSVAGCQPDLLRVIDTVSR